MSQSSLFSEGWRSREGKDIVSLVSCVYCFMSRALKVSVNAHRKVNGRICQKRTTGLPMSAQF